MRVGIIYSEMLKMAVSVIFFGKHLI